MSDEKIGAAANYGGTVGDAMGRPGPGKPASAAEDRQATVSEQLDRILPKED